MNFLLLHLSNLAPSNILVTMVNMILDGFSRNPLDMRAQRMQSQHLERFQTEVLPPRSANSISVAHNPLLSPIRSPGFISSKNPAYIIEAATKLIELSQRSTTEGNFPSLASSSSTSFIPFRVKDIKGKMDASQSTSRPVHKSEDQTPMSMKKHLKTRCKSGSKDSKASEALKRVASQRSKSKEKPVSFEDPEKANIIRKRDGLTSMGNKSSSEKLKERNHVRASRICRDVPNTHNKLENNSYSRSHSEVLKLNNPKQNGSFAEKEEKIGSCSFRKESNLSTNYIHGQTNRNVNKTVINRNVNKTVVNRNVNKTVVNNVVTSRNTSFVVAESGKELKSLRANAISKKRILNSGNTWSGDSATENTVMVQDVKFVKRNIEIEGDSKWDEYDMRRNSLDVVAFTFTSPIKKSGSESSSYSRILKDESEEFNVVGGDALSVLLDQKLKELTSRAEMSHEDLPDAGSLSNSVNSYGNNNSSIMLLRFSPVDSDMCKSKWETQYNSECPSILEQGLQPKKEEKGLEYMESDDNDKRNIDLQVSTSFSHSLSATSSHTFDVSRSSSVDTATSISVGGSNWELQYIEEFALGQSDVIIAPYVFDQLEYKKMDSYKIMEEDWLERKVLFDCVYECLEVRCGKLFQMTMLQRRLPLPFVNDLYRVILSWRNVELMVDEVVDKDMSGKNGKWVDFDIEALEVGTGIEERMVNSLVDELVDDFLS